MNDSVATGSGPGRAGSWHLDGGLAGGYAAGLLSVPLAASVEAHLVGCAPCRALLRPHVDVPRLDRVWSGIREQVEAPRPGLLERLLARLGMAETTARLLAATPSLRGAWLSGVALVLALALAAAHSGDRGVAFFLALAPVLPVLGVAAAFGPHTDPLHEVGVAAPYSAVRLLVLRSVAVVAVTVVLAALAALLLPVGHWMAAAWLLPSLALTSLTLALSRDCDPVRPAAALSGLWLAVSLSALRPGGDPALVAGAAVQVASLAAIAAALVLVLARRTAAPLLLRRLP